MNRLPFLLTIILFSVLVAHRAPAAEAVGMEILLDGKQIAGFTVTYAGESEAEIWLMLNDTPLTFERDFEIPVDSAEGTSATLTGSIEVRTHRRGDAGSGTKTEQLQLVRRGPADWYVTASEVDRTLGAAGLKIPAKSPSPKPIATRKLLVGTFFLVGLVFVVVLVVLLLSIRTRAHVKDP